MKGVFSKLLEIYLKMKYSRAIGVLLQCWCQEFYFGRMSHSFEYKLMFDFICLHCYLNEVYYPNVFGHTEF